MNVFNVCYGYTVSSYISGTVTVSFLCPLWQTQCLAQNSKTTLNKLHSYNLSSPLDYKLSKDGLYLVHFLLLLLDLDAGSQPRYACGTNGCMAKGWKHPPIFAWTDFPNDHSLWRFPSMPVCTEALYIHYAYTHTRLERLSTCVMPFIAKQTGICSLRQGDASSSKVGSALNFHGLTFSYIFPCSREFNAL